MTGLCTRSQLIVTNDSDLFLSLFGACRGERPLPNPRRELRNLPRPADQADQSKLTGPAPFDVRVYPRRIQNCFAQ